MNVDRSSANALILCGNCLRPEEKPVYCTKCIKIYYCSEVCKNTASKVHEKLCGQEGQWKNPVIYLDQEVCDLKGGTSPLTQREFYSKIHAFYMPYTIFPETNLFQNALSYDVKKAMTILDFEEGMGYGILAGEDVEAGMLIEEFGGVYRKTVENTYRSIVYSLGDSENGYYNPEFLMGLGALINDGPPNCVFCTDEEGAHVVSLRCIKKGEPLYLNYGNWHIVKTGKYQIKRDLYLEIKGKIKTHGLVQDPDQRELYALMLYVLGTPAVLFRLLIDGVLPLEETLALLIEKRDFLVLDMREVKKLPLLLKNLSLLKGEKALLDHMSIAAFMDIVLKVFFAYPDLASSKKLLPFGQVLDRIGGFLLGNFSNWMLDIDDLEQLLNSICPEQGFDKFVSDIVEQVQGLNSPPLTRFLKWRIEIYHKDFKDVKQSCVVKRLQVLEKIFLRLE